MGWMGSSSSTSQAPTTTSMNPTQQGWINNVYNQAAQVEQRPYVPYTGQTVAGFSPTQISGMNAMVDVGNSGIGRGEINAGIDGTKQAMGWSPQQVGVGNVDAQQVQSSNVGAQDVSSRNVTPGQFAGTDMTPYMNPFIQNVANRTSSDMERAREIQLNNDESGRLSQGSYGGSRHGIADSETNRGFFDRLGSTLGSLYAGGYRDATGLAVGDINRRYEADTGNANRQVGVDTSNANRHLTADMSNADRRLTADTGNADRTFSADTGNANRSLQSQEFNSDSGWKRAQMLLQGGQQLAGMGGQLRSNAYADAQAKLGVGGMQQGLQQQQLDDAYARWREAQNYPRESVSWLNNIVRGLPSMGGTSTGGGATTTNNPSRMSGAAAGATAGSIFGPWGAAAGGVLGGILSDKRIKSNVRQLTSGDQVLEGMKKTPVSTWNYDPGKGGPDDGQQPHVGPMAQDMKRNLGIGDGRSLPMVDVMGAHHAAISTLAKKVDKLSATTVKPKIRRVR